MPTRRGLAVALAGLACLAAGWVLGYPELAVLGCAGLLAVAAAVPTVLRRPHVELSRDVYPVRVSRGQPAVCALSVRNAARWYLPRVVVEDRMGERTTPIELPPLRPGGTAMLSYRLETHRRGVFDVGPLRWHRYDPLALARSGPEAAATRTLAPLEILQPDGPGFTVDDGWLRWGPWQLRITMHPIEGLVLHEVSYVAGERVRPVLYRASMAEMVVPYGSTSLSHWWKRSEERRVGKEC